MSKLKSIEQKNDHFGKTFQHENDLSYKHLRVNQLRHLNCFEITKYIKSMVKNIGIQIYESIE
jgi:hypothetical protein